MKILHVSQCALPLTINGVTRAVDIAARELTAMGHELHLLAPHLPGNAKYDYHLPVRAYEVPRIPKDYPISLGISNSMRRHLMQQKWDVVHCHHPFGLGNIGLQLAYQLRIPCVATFHTRYDEYGRTYGKRIPQWLLQPSLWYVVRRFFNTCDMVIAPSSQIRTFIQNNGISVPTEVLPTAVELPKLQLPRTCDRLRTDFNIPSHGIVVATVGRVAREKNLELLFRALRLASQKEQRPIYGLIVGGGPALDYYKEQVKQLGLEHRVRFTDFIRPDQVPVYLSASDIFAFTSLTDTQGLSIVEAQACGLPCVVVRGSGATEMVSHGITGRVVNPEIETVAGTLLQLAYDAVERSKLGTTAQHIATMRSPRRHAEKLVDLYTKLRAAHGYH